MGLEEKIYTKLQILENLKKDFVRRYLLAYNVTEEEIDEKYLDVFLSEIKKEVLKC